jgi:hypothetical protein
MIDRMIRKPAYGAGTASSPQNSVLQAIRGQAVPALLESTLMNDRLGFLRWICRVCATLLAHESKLTETPPRSRQEMIERDWAGLRPRCGRSWRRSGPANATSDLRDLRNCLWASIDNDDSRDLDQLTVAESLAGGRVESVSRLRTWMHWCESRRRSRPRGGEHHLVYTPAIIFPMLPRCCPPASPR